MNPEELAQIVAYYVALNITQYRILPNASQTIALFCNEALCDGLPQVLERAFDLDSAIGNQLTILGNIVGVPRWAYGLDLNHSFFSFVRYNDLTPRPGFGRYNDNPYPSAIWLRYLATGDTQLTDFEMLACIQIKIIQNNIYTSLADVAEALWSVFGNDIYVIDNLNMSITYHATAYGAYYDILLIANYLGILPRPMGVAVSVVTP
jgi:Protein of unknown function (DUF2612)